METPEASCLLLDHKIPEKTSKIKNFKNFGVKFKKKSLKLLQQFSIFYIHQDNRFIDTLISNTTIIFYQKLLFFKYIPISICNLYIFRFHEKFRFADLDDDDLTPLLFQELDHPIDIFTDSMMEQNDSSPFLEEDEGEPEQEEQKPDEEPEPEGEPQPACDLDRVGSFFEKELSQKALEVLPKCDETFDCVLNERGSRMNSIEIQKMG